MPLIEQRLRDIFSDFPEIKLVILFGSVADGSENPDSDIDLALLGNTPLPPTLRIDLTERIATKLGRPVDIIDVYDAPEPILGEALKGRRIVGDNTTFAQLLTRHLFNAADFLPLRQRILKERRTRWIQ